MRSGKNKKRLHVQMGLFDDIARTAQAVQAVNENADLVIQVSSKIDKVRHLLKYDGSQKYDLIENLMARLEDLAAFVVGLQTTTSWQNCLSLIHLYVRSFFPQSIVISIMKWINEALHLNAKVIDTQSGTEFETSGVTTNIQTFKQVISNWKNFRNSDLARNMANVVDILVTTGFMQCEDPKKVKNPFRTAEFNKFSTRVWDVQLEAVDFTTMVFDTLIFFVERGYAAFVNKDPTLLLYSDNETHLLDMEFSLLASALPLLECGRLDELASRMNDVPVPGTKPIVDAADFDNRVDVMISKISYLLKFEKHPAARSALSAKLTVMSKLRTAMILQQRSSPIREKPFCIEIFGGSSVAKTTLCNIFARVLLHANGFASTKDHIVTCNDLDKYQSEYTSSKTAVILDDYGNTRVDHYDVAPTKKIIDFCNNVNLAALNAEVEKKGNVMIRPKLVLLTTNVKGLLAEHFSNEPVSIQRRFEVIVTARLRPDFIDPQSGGPLKNRMAGVAIPDAWELLLETVQIVRGKFDRAELKSVFTETTNGETMPKYVDIFTALDTLKRMSVEHFDTQRTYVSCVEDFFNVDFCQHSMPPDLCRECLCSKSKDDIEMFLDCKTNPTHVLTPHAGTEFDESDADEFISLAPPGNGVFSYDEETDTSFVDYFADKRVRTVVGIAALAGTVSAIYMIYRVYCVMHRTVDVQGDVVSQPIKLDTDVANPWKTVRPVELPVSLASKTTTIDDLVSLLSKKIGYVLVRPANTSVERKVSDIVPMLGDRWLMPWHMVCDTTVCYELEVRTHKNGALGKSFKQIVSTREIERITDTDYVIVRLANGGDNYDLSKFLIEGKVDLGWTRSKLYARTVLRLADGSTEFETVHVHARQEVETQIGGYDAYCYNYPRATFTGQCMMTLLTDSASPAILGFHLAGLTGETFGAAGVLLRRWFDEANLRLTNRAPLTCHSSGTFRYEQFGKNFLPSDRIDAKHASLWLTQDLETGQQPCLEVLGAHPQGTTRFKSNVRKSVISDAVAEIMQLPRLHGAPNCAKGWIHWQRDLDLISKPQGLFDPRVLCRAASDLQNKIFAFMDENPTSVALIHPYDLDTVLAGVDGITSVDGVDLKTSMGWPLNMAKSNFITPSNRVVENVTRPLDIDPMILEEVERVESILASGERCYTIFRANKKDEATKFTKDKIRTFAGAPYSLTHVTRKFYLPLVRFIQTHWKHMECAVGINAHGVQWNELAEWMLVFGRDRMLAGDFKNYDKCISPTLMTEAFGILISMARKAGYNATQIAIMEGLATEICYPLYEWDGVFVQAFGSNPSGHPLTVIVNNIANSLYMRYAYYAMYKDEAVPSFSERVRLMCYGDDNFQNVHPDEKRYNFQTVHEELGKVGILFTPADKSDRIETLITIDQVSFLKRGFLYNEDLQLWMAPLEEASISKSLHNYLHKKGSPTLPTQIAGQVISGAIREYFRYPKEFFEMRRTQLLSIAEQSGVLVYIPNLLTYEDMKGELFGEFAVPYPEFPSILECA